MLKFKMRNALAFSVACCLVTLTGCGTQVPSLVTPSTAVLLPGQTLQFSVVGGADSPQRWSVNGAVGGSPSAGTITADGLYTAPSTASGQRMEIAVKGRSDSATVTILNASSFASGSVATTQNPLVAAYTMTSPAGASVRVQFGLDTSYGFSTSIVPAPANGGSVTALVAGMRAGTTYHMQAVVNLIDGSQLLDSDHTFATGTIPAQRLPGLTTQLTGAGTPSDGIELLSLRADNLGGNLLSTVATDLDGNVIWYYDLESSDFPFPIKPLPNGHMLVVTSPVVAGTGVNEVREIDLAGDVVNRITLSSVNQALKGVASFQVESFHHDVAVLPNGHLILLVNYPVTLNDMPGIPAGTLALGDALIDWDPQRGPVWTWSTFDHLNLSHAPNGVGDWTHANAVIYSPDDGNLIVSMRNQNWVIKIAYRDGAGDGSILWRLGPDGDFTLPGQEAPIEWNYGQHYPTVVSSNSSGIFSLMFFNNGNNRLMDSNNTVCSSPGVGACYSSVPVLQLNEFTKTATVQSEENLLPYYSICCGDALVLPNGDIEFDVADDIVVATNISHIEEMTQAQVPELVWKMDIPGQLAYRALRIPSLYPGQVWPANAHSTPGHVLPVAARKPAASAKPVPGLP
jgi:arylsulfate sulfotransferase